MEMKKPATPLAAAVYAAQQFKEMLEIQPPGVLFFPGRGNRDPRTTASFLYASELLDEVVSEMRQGTASTGCERKLVHSIGDVVSDQGAHVPADLLQVVTHIASKLDVLVKLGEQSTGCSVDGRPFEIATRLRGHGDESVEAVESKRDAVHMQGPEKVSETTLCHGTEVK